MEDSNHKWPTLLEKFLSNEINDNELQALEQYKNSCPLKMRQFNQLTHPQSFAEDLQFYDSINTDKLWAKLEAELSANDLAEPQPIKSTGTIIRRIVILTIAAAVAATIIFILQQPHSSIDPDTLIASLSPEIKDHTYIKAISGKEYDLEEDNGSSSLGAFSANLLYQDNVLKINPDANKQSDYTHFDLVTAPQKQMQLLLTDGSIIKLSSASAIRFPVRFKKNKREVQLKGQAFFDVTTNEDVPFEVNLTNGVQVKAVGTSFNITSYEAGRIIMTLIAGTVKMTYGKMEIVVNEGQQIEFTKENKFRFIKQPDLEQATAWMNNEFNFNNKDIKDVIREIASYYNYNVVFKKPISPMAASGIFDIKKQNLTKIISAIEQLYQVDITPEGNTLIVSQVGPH